MILDPTDQRIRDQGFNFVPFNQYLASPFQIPQNQETGEARVSAGLPTIYKPKGGGGGGDYAASLGLGSDSRGYIGNYQGMDFEDMYKYTPQGIQMEGIEYPAIAGDIDTQYPNTIINEYIKPAPEIFEPQQQNMFQKAFGKGIDLSKTVGRGLASLATGIPFAGPLLERGLGAISSQFENRPLGAAVIDEFGNVYDEEELNKQNALGGYYSEAARSARRRTARIENMLERKRRGKKISEKNLAELQAQEAAQEAARQAAADAMQAENRDRNRGGYQAGYDSDFMEGPGGGKDMGQEASSPGSSGPGGSDSMGSFMDGGIVDLVDIYD